MAAAVAESKAVRLRMGAVEDGPEAVRNFMPKDRKELNDELQAELYDKINAALQVRHPPALTPSLPPSLPP